MTVNEFFDKVYVINLDRRKERWEETAKTLDSLEIEAERFSAYDGENLKAKSEHLNPYEKGCLMSHLELIRRSRKEGYESILCLEDDPVFIDDFVNIFDEVSENVPDDWHFFYLGGNIRGEPEKVDGHIYRMKNVLATHAVGVHEDLYDIALKETDFRTPIDNQYRDYQRNYPCYITIPRLIYQREGYSDIVQGHRNYDDVLKDVD